MINLNESQKKFYIDVRAEQIKEFQDRENGHLFKQPYSLEAAKAIAAHQLDCDIVKGKLRVPLEDLLFQDNDTCREIAANNICLIAKESINA